jgi:mRNA interferase RelE/StbE
LRDHKQLDRSVQNEIIEYMENWISATANLGDFGKPLRGTKFGLWRYRVRDYRIVCELQDNRKMLVVAVGHRSIVLRRLIRVAVVVTGIAFKDVLKLRSSKRNGRAIDLDPFKAVVGEKSS